MKLLTCLSNSKPQKESKKLSTTETFKGNVLYLIGKKKSTKNDEFFCQ